MAPQKFYPNKYVIALTNKERLQKDVVPILFDKCTDYFLHIDRASGSYYPASGFFGIAIFNTFAEAKRVLKYCEEYNPVICAIICKEV